MQIAKRHRWVHRPSQLRDLHGSRAALAVNIIVENAGRRVVENPIAGIVRLGDPRACVERIVPKRANNTEPGENRLAKQYPIAFSMRKVSDRAASG